MALIQFTDNYEDLSTDVGFQFKFYCERCGNGYMSEFHPFGAGRAVGFLRAVSDLVGRGHNVADSAYEIQRAVGGPAHDNALKTAVAEVKLIAAALKRVGGRILVTHCGGPLEDETTRARQFAAGQDIVANGNFKINIALNNPLIHSFVMTT